MIDPTTLEAMRSVADQTLPDEAAVLRKVRTDDGAGGSTEEWIEQPEPEQCRLAGSTPSAAVAADQVGEAKRPVVRLRVSTSVQAGDRLGITLVDGRPGGLWHVEGLEARSNQVHATAQVTEV